MVCQDLLFLVLDSICFNTTEFVFYEKNNCIAFKEPNFTQLKCDISKMGIVCLNVTDKLYQMIDYVIIQLSSVCVIFQKTYLTETLKQILKLLIAIAKEIGEVVWMAN